jgi:hypothetical protein
MSKSKHTEAQMISALKQLEAGRKAENVARETTRECAKLRFERQKHFRDDWQATGANRCPWSGTLQWVSARQPASRSGIFRGASYGALTISTRALKLLI